MNKVKRAVIVAAGAGVRMRPLTLTRQGGADGLFEIIWPEKASFPR